jgi:hypothetical protein
MFVKHPGNTDNAVKSLFLGPDLIIIPYLCEFKYDVPDDRHVNEQYCDLILNYILIVQVLAF